MKYFAKVCDGKVLKVMVADADFFKTFVDDSPGDWIECFHFGEPGYTKGDFPDIGHTYDSELKCFIAPQQYPSWILNKETGFWEAPVPKPDKLHKWEWDEENTSWKKVKVYVQP